VDLNDNCGSCHNLDCESNLGLGSFDSRCLRCTKIKHVIALRRKRLAGGASDHECDAADAIAAKLVASYKLTRGECFDRAYSTFVKEAVVKAATIKRERTYGRTWKPSIDDILDEVV
jgi:hypothetical protein